MLYIINCILPLFYFLMLDVGTFFISEARGEKLSLKVTLLLSISVLLLILQDILPSTSDQLPLIGGSGLGQGGIELRPTGGPRGPSYMACYYVAWLS